MSCRAIRIAFRCASWHGRSTYAPTVVFGGAGGGESLYFPKRAWQKHLPGAGREVPDASALADPYTGFAIVFTEDGVQYAQAGWGGTSLASPIFTAVWAIADQYNGAPLGQAGPALARLKAGQITDVVATSPVTDFDVTGAVHDASGTTYYSAAISFGTDSSLTVTPGWDSVTGFGEPNGLPFVQGVSGKTVGAASSKN